MSAERRVNVSPVAAVAAMVTVLLIGAGGTYLLLRGDASRTSQTMAADSSGPARVAMPSSPSSSPVERTSAPVRDVVVTLAPATVARSGIAVTPVTVGTAMDRVRLPGVVEPNAYRQVIVTSLAGGKILSVSAQLGDRV